MRRAGTLAAVGLVLVVVAEVAFVAVTERRASAALCGVEVDVASPATLRLLAGRRLPFTVRLDGNDLDRLVPRPAAVRRIAIADGRLRLETVGGLAVPADLRLDHGTVLVTPAVGLLDLDRLALRVPLVDVLPIGVEVEGLTVTADDTVVVRGRADPRELGTLEPGGRCPTAVS